MKIQPCGEAEQRAARLASKVIKLLCGEVATENPRVSRRVSSFMRNVAGLMDLARRSGLRLHNLHSDPIQEFYCDVSQGKRDLGFVSRGWTDPGVRVGDLIYFSGAAAPKFKANIEQIMNACTSQGVAFFVRHSRPSSVEVELWTPVYGDLHGTAALREALKSFQECRERIGKICPFSSTPPEGPRPSRSNGHGGHE